LFEIRNDKDLRKLTVRNRRKTEIQFVIVGQNNRNRSIVALDKVLKLSMDNEIKREVNETRIQNRKEIFLTFLYQDFLIIVYI